MNSTIGKFAKWYVRIIDPKIIQYEFRSRGETVSAERFECVLVSKDPAQYMLATVPSATITAAVEPSSSQDAGQVDPPNEPGYHAT